MKKKLIGCGLLVTVAFTLIGLLWAAAAWEQRSLSGTRGMPRRYVTYEVIPSDGVLSRLHAYFCGPPAGDPVTYQHYFWFSVDSSAGIPRSPWVGGLMAAGGLAATGLGLAMLLRRREK